MSAYIFDRISATKQLHPLETEDLNLLDDLGSWCASFQFQSNDIEDNKSKA